MYQNYIFDLYGTLVDIHTNEKKAYLWKKMSLFFGMKGAAYEPKELRMAYETKIKEQEAALGSGMPPGSPLYREIRYLQNVVPAAVLRIKLFR